MDSANAYAVMNILSVSLPLTHPVPISVFIPVLCTSGCGGTLETPVYTCVPCSLAFVLHLRVRWH